MVDILHGPTILFFSLFIVMLICFPDWSHICNNRRCLCSFRRRTRYDPLQVPLDVSTEDDNDFHESSISSIVNETFSDVGSV